MTNESVATETPSTTEEQTPAVPNIAKNLFWDDVRIGLQVVAIGGIVLALGSLLAQYNTVPIVLSYLIVAVGAFASIIGLKICCSLPKEGGIGSLLLPAAMGCAILAFVTLLGWLVGLVPAAVSAPVVAVLAGLAGILFAIAISPMGGFLGDSVLAFHGHLLTGAMAIFTIAAVIMTLTGVASTDGPRNILEIGGLALAGYLLFVASTLSFAIGRVQQGLLPYRTVSEEEQGLAEEVPEDDMPKAPPTPAPYFNPDEYKVLNKEDTSAGAAIVGLMTAVFTVGVVLYTIIAVITS